MRKTWRRIFGTTALAFVLCLTGMVMTGEAQAQRFVDNGNGTVTDTMTNLMWTKNANPLGELTWHDAMSKCRSFRISGIGGWRLPSQEELVDLSHAIKGGHPFTGVRSYYWSSTTPADNTNLAWYVAVDEGDVIPNTKASTSSVWPVRAGL